MHPEIVLLYCMLGLSAVGFPWWKGTDVSDPAQHHGPTSLEPPSVELFTTAFQVTSNLSSICGCLVMTSPGTIAEPPT